MPVLERKDIPAFIYLIDDIIEHAEEDDENIYMTISEKGSDADNQVHERTIRRAFKLRESLKQGKFIKEGNKRLTVKALNVLTAYRYKSELKRFRILQKDYKSEIDDYYENNKPSDKILNELFKKRPKQINELEVRKEELLSLLAELDHNSLDFFLTNWFEKYFNAKLENTNIEKLKSDLASYIDSQIKKTDKKYKRILSLYHIFGSLVLVFFSVEHYEDLKEFLVKSFIEEHNKNDLINDDDDDLDDDDDDFYDV